MSHRIGGDWVESEDKKTGKTYYANLKTKETSWEYPEELKKDSTSVFEKESEGIWSERKDPKSGKIFYYNSKTKKTTWDKPESGQIIELPKAGSKEDAAMWVEREDPNGRSYFYHKETKETRWDPPPGVVTAKGSGPVKKHSDGEIMAQFLPSTPTNTNNGHKSVRLGTQVGDVPGNKFAKLRALAKGKGLDTTAVEQEVQDNPEDYRRGLIQSVALDAPINPEDALDIEKLVAELAVDVRHMPMEEYGSKHFNMKRKGMMKKQTTVAKMLQWKDDLIKKPLHSMSDKSLDVEAVQAFRNIVSFMGDRTSSKDDIAHAGKLMSNTVHAPEELRDELFCQLIKQTNLNPKKESTIKGWQLMAICAGTYPPSSKLEPYLLSYCDQNTKSNLPDGTKIHDGVKEYAQYCMLRIKKSSVLGPRREVPTAMEIQAAMNRQPVVIRVHLLDGHYQTVPAEAWTTMRELNALVATKLKIKDASPFATFEISSNDEERVLEDDDRVLDLLSFWQREFSSAKKGRAAPTYQFIYKQHLFVDIPDNDDAAVDLAYIQAVHDVVDSRYPCTKDDTLTLAALQAQEKFEDYSGSSPFDEGLSDFVPVKYLRAGDPKDLEDEILHTYAKLQGYSGMEAKLNYLDYVRSWKIYGSSYYFVEPQNSRDFPSDVVLAINAKGVLVVDPETKDFLAEYPYSEVVTWGHSASTFVLVVGNLIRQTKLYFRSDQGTEMNTLVHAYVNRILGQQQKND